MEKQIPSPQKQTYLDWIVDGKGSCVLEAVAGSGKTTALIDGLGLMKGSIFFGAYNKKIALEIEQRAPKRMGLTISTMHSAGFRMWRQVTRNVKVDENKMKNLFQAACERNPTAGYENFTAPVLALADYSKQAAVGATTDGAEVTQYQDLIDHFDIDCLGDEDMVIRLTKKLLQQSADACFTTIDFEDMIFAPLYHKVKPIYFDWVLVDEAQDTNASRRALALKMLRPGGRLVAVGDRHQAIYGFTGADSNALDLIAAETDAVRLPLTVTYRCPKAVVEYAHRFVAHIHAHESAPEGSVTYMPSSIKATAIAAPGDAILCRKTMPLISAAYQFIAEGIPAKVEGREIGAGLKRLASRWKVKTFAALTTKLDEYAERETAKWIAKDQPSKAQTVEDTVACVRVLLDRCFRIDPKCSDVVLCICSEIDKIFGDNVDPKTAVLLSTIHKSKGREWDRVVWLQTGPSKWAKQPWELEQENNLCYVATTRAKRELVLWEPAL